MKAISTVVLCLSLILHANAQDKAKGIIKFTDGTEKQFNMVKYVNANPEVFREGFPAYYQNTFRQIPFDKLSRVLIKNYQASSSTIQAKLEITTKTNITFTSEVKLDNISVSVMDELTNTNMDIIYPFCNPATGKLVIKEIVFN